MSSSERQSGPGRGFAGLSAMVSDVDAAVETAKQASASQSTDAAEVRSQATATSQSDAATPSARTTPNQPTTRSPGGKWLLGVGAVVGVFWLISINSGTKSTQAIPAGTNVSAPGPKTNDSSGRNSSQQATAPTSTVVTEDRPSVGTNNVLGAAQIRYCLAEDIRLNAAKVAVDQYLDAEVDRYNTLVSDYNSRCEQFRYRRGALESARAEVEARRATLEAEGIARFRGSVGRDPDRQRPAKRSQGAGSRASDASGQNRNQNVAPAYQTPDASVAQPSSLAPSGSIALADLSEPERNSIEAACSSDKYLNGPAAYNACLKRQLASLTAQNRRPDLSGLSSDERQSIESACSSDKYLNGPAPYNACLRRQLATLGSTNRRPDLSGLTNENRRSIEMACSSDKYLNGPAAYNTCLAQQLSRLGR